MVKRPLNLTIDEDLIEWLKEYVKSERTTASAFVNQCLAKIKSTKEAEQRGKQK